MTPYVLVWPALDRGLTRRRQQSAVATVVSAMEGEQCDTAGKGRAAGHNVVIRGRSQARTEAVSDRV
jgi:hypothetical protein